jgi:hypothetical protein
MGRRVRRSERKTDSKGEWRMKKGTNPTKEEYNPYSGSSVATLAYDID